MGSSNSATFAEKIIASHCGRVSVNPGEIVGVRLDLLVSDELSFPQIVADFRSLGATAVFDPAAIAVFADHDAPARDLNAAEGMRLTRAFLHEQGAPPLFEGRNAGIAHLVIPEEGLLVPGQLVAGYDSHVLTAGAIGAFAVGIGATDAAVSLAFGELWIRVPETVRVTLTGSASGWTSPKDVALQLTRTLGQDGCLYQALEFHGEYAEAIGMDGRFTLTNIAIEVGAKSAAFAVDETTQAYLAGRLQRPFTPVWSDVDAVFAREVAVDVDVCEPLVALPGGPDLAVPLSEAPDGHVDQVFIGSCSNGRLSDIRIAAEILRGRRVHPGTRLIVVPGSARVFRQALAEGLIADLAEAGAVVGPAGCGPCAGLHMGVLADGETAVATSTRNFPGRMGSVGSRVFLAGPAVAAATAAVGRIAAPDELLEAPPAHLVSALQGG